MRKKTELLFAVLLAAVTVLVVNCGKTADTATTAGISGTVTSSGAGLQGVTVTLTGAGSGTATTDGSGNFSFAGLSQGGYTVTPAKSGYTFTPASSAETLNDSGITGVLFTAATTTTGANAFDGTYTGTWNKTCPNCGINASNGTFTATVSSGVFSGTQFILTSGDSGVRFDTGTVSSSGAITGTGATPSQCSSSVSTFSGQITTSTGGAAMTMAYSRPVSPEGCQAESGSITATRTP